jgi:tetratricopeptide (TPR) repeat protein
MRGEIEEALRDAGRALELAEAAGATWSIAQASMTLGNAMDLAGDAERGGELVERAAELWTQVGDLKNAMVAGSNLGANRLGSREPTEAVAVIREALDLALQLGDTWSVSVGFCNLAIALAVLGDSEGARAALREALNAARASGARVALAEAVITLALIAVVEGNTERAVVLWAAGISAVSAVGYALGPELARYVDDLLEPLSQTPNFERLWGEGAGMPLDDALTLGLDGDTAER